ncbi:Crp/Fnr family transcriptional regulator [Zhengella sp. ZM62]|uniref:Crp/Fnr family transcriptional regulator n=1 Tax=Zhengella sedimenti TaxID=3390035 RepID=UPI0039771B78
MASISSPAIHEAGETIIAQGETLAHVGIVRSGVVKITNTTADGRHMVIGLIEEARLIGNIFDRTSRFAYECATDASICLIPRQAFVNLAQQDADFSCGVLETAQRQAEEIQEWLTLFNCRTTLQRLAGYLFALMTRRQGDMPAGEPMALEIPVSRKDLAPYLGTTTETLSRNMQQLARRGIIRVVDGRHVVIVDKKRLSSMAASIGDELQSLTHGRPVSTPIAAVSGKPPTPLHAA